MLCAMATNAGMSSHVPQLRANYDTHDCMHYPCCAHHLIEINLEVIFVTQIYLFSFTLSSASCIQELSYHGIWAC